MSKEIPDIAQWEGNDSELAKYTIFQLDDEIKRLNMIIDIKNKRIDELNKRLDKKNNRIDEAIEYIERNCLEFNNKYACQGLNNDNVDVLLDILRGEDND